MNFYEHTAPFNAFRLAVGQGHELYVEQHGNPEGIPTIYLHGGPGGGCSPSTAKIFDKEKFNLAIFDQRGSGRSTPYASVECNTVSHLVTDIEKLRQHLEFEKVALVGASWGSALSLFYSRRYHENVSRMLLQGTFFADEHGTKLIAEESKVRLRAPEYFDQYRNFIPVEERERGLIPAYNKLLRQGTTSPEAIKAHMLFNLWDTALAFPEVDEEIQQDIRANPKEDFSLSRIFMHYAEHEFFDGNKSWLLTAQNEFKDIPITVVHGISDWVCPHANSLELVQAYPHTDLITVDGGHTGPVIADAMKKVLDGWQP